MTRAELRKELKDKSKAELIMMLQAVDGFIPSNPTKAELIDSLIYEMIGRKARMEVFEADYRPANEKL